MKLTISKKLGSTPFLILVIVLGGITLTTVLAQTVSVTQPYILNNGTKNNLVINSLGSVGIGNLGNTSTPFIPTLFYVKQINDNNLGGMAFQNAAATGSLRFWIDTQNNGYITSSVSPRIALNANGTTGLLNANVGIGTSAPSQKLDVKGNVHLSGVLVCQGCVNNADIANNSINGTQIISGSNIAAGNITATNVIAQGKINATGVINAKGGIVNTGNMNVTGSIRMTNSTGGVILTSPDHLHCILLKVNNTGTLVTSPTPC